MIFSIDLFSTKRNTFLHVLYNLHAPIWIAVWKRGVTFYICFRKRKYPEKGSLRKGGGVPNLEEIMYYFLFISCCLLYFKLSSKHLLWFIVYYYLYFVFILFDQILIVFLKQKNWNVAKYVSFLHHSFPTYFKMKKTSKWYYGFWWFQRVMI